MPHDPSWIDFKALRKGLRFEEVLASYAVEVKRRPGDRHVGFCPLPTHQGNRRSPSFSAKLDIGVWQCFGCKASGNVLDFAVMMDGGDPENPRDLRATALRLRDRFNVSFGKPDDSPRRRQSTPERPTPERHSPSPPPRSDRPTLVNPPLDFELKDLDPEHPYLPERGFRPETVGHFGLGYCNRGLMRGRIAIPLHDDRGQRVGYAGRLTQDRDVNERTPKYLLPGPRERDGTVLEFHKGLFLYNGHRVTGPVDDLVVVEGFPSTWWLWQCGYRDVVALMGSDCSAEQARLIVSSVRPRGHVWVFSDGDRGGEQCAASTLARVAAHRFCRRVRITQGQPTDHTPGDLAELLWPL